MGNLEAGQLPEGSLECEGDTPSGKQGSFKNGKIPQTEAWGGNVPNNGD